MGLSLVEARLTEVKVSTDLAVVARSLQGKHIAAVTPGKINYGLLIGMQHVHKALPSTHSWDIATVFS